MEWHIKCDEKEISRYVFTPGDQARAIKIAEHFDNYHLITQNRGYTVYSGEYRGVPMTVCGTGMGGPVVAIGIEELAHMGADTFIRVGSCGVFQKWQKTGDVVIASGCETTRLRLLVATRPSASLTSTATLVVPAAVGVPLMVFPAALNPVGRLLIVQE